MAPQSVSLSTLFALSTLLLTSSASSSSSSFHPSASQARARAPAIFNAVHSALRQWGSSVNHNGMSALVATVPEGNLFYHGTHRGPDRFGGLEWLAFEVEHAGVFAQSWTPRQRTPRNESRRGRPGEGGGGGGRSTMARGAADAAQAPLIGAGVGGSEQVRVDGHDWDLTWWWDPVWRRLWNWPGSSDASSGAGTARVDGGDDGVTLTSALDVPVTGTSATSTATTTRPAGFPMPTVPVRGYMHVYRAERDLHLLYLDGMAAAKGSMGALDTQDLLLLYDADPPVPPNGGLGGLGGERERSKGLCKLAQDWGLDGVIRMEAGFEIIYCDFGPGGGLELVGGKGLASPWNNQSGTGLTADMPIVRWPPPEDDDDGRSDEEKRQSALFLELNLVREFEFLRAVSRRYWGLPRGRIVPDFGSMVSAFWYPLDLSNTADPSRPELPRLVNANASELAAMRGSLEAAVAERRKGWEEGGGGSMGSGSRPTGAGAVDWQGVADLIVTRYATRLSYMSSPGATCSFIRSELMALLDLFIDYSLPEFGVDASPPAASLNSTDASPAVAAVIDRCTSAYLAVAEATRAAWTPSDALIYAAMSGVSRMLCEGLWRVRELVSVGPGEPGCGDEKLAEGKAALDGLMRALDWTVWRECSTPCDVDQFCFIAMFPAGAKEDHFTPRCKNMTEVATSHGYWFDFW